MDENKDMDQVKEELEKDMRSELEEVAPGVELDEKSTDDLADWIEEQGIQLRY